MDEQVLVTGASGFIALQTILDLLEQGYRVRGSVRSFDKAEQIRETLRPHTPMADMLELVEASLDHDRGWAAAVEGCQYVLHIASPFPAERPKDADELIRPARDGALRVLKASKAAGVSRVVLTSSMAAIGYGWGKNRPEPLTEEHWSNPDELKDNTPYARSKTIAEKAAWDFVNSAEGEGLELAVINPVGVLGPLLGKDVSTSTQIISQLLAGSVPRLPKLSFALVDVRDVSAAHIRAMTLPEAAGKRFIVSDRTLWMTEIADILRKAFAEHAERIPEKELPNWSLRLLANVNPPLKNVLPELGKFRVVSNERMKSVLEINPTPAEVAIKETARSLLDLGLV